MRENNQLTRAMSHHTSELQNTNTLYHLTKPNELISAGKGPKMSMHSCDFVDFMDEELASILGEAFPNSFSHHYNNISSPASTFTTAPISPSTTLLCSTQQPPQFRHAKQPKSNTFSDLSTTNFSIDSSSFVLNFGKANSPQRSKPAKKPKKPKKVALVSQPIRNQVSNTEDESKEEPIIIQKRSRCRLEYDHIGAERKRREQLNQLFITLSAIVPGLKKMDKSSVLGDAITYLKNLQEKVKTLEEQTATQTIESVVLVKKSQVQNEEYEDEALPEIEARVCDKNILLNILCAKRKGLLVRILGEVEKLNLAIVNTSFLPFGSMAFHITIATEMEEEFNISGKDVVAAIRVALSG